MGLRRGHSGIAKDRLGNCHCQPIDWIDLGCLAGDESRETRPGGSTSLRIISNHFIFPHLENGTASRFTWRRAAKRPQRFRLAWNFWVAALPARESPVPYRV